MKVMLMEADHPVPKCPKAGAKNNAMAGFPSSGHGGFGSGPVPITSGPHEVNSGSVSRPRR